MSKTTKTSPKSKDAKLKEAMDRAWEKNQAEKAAKADAKPKGKKAKAAAAASDAAPEPAATDATQATAAPKPAKAAKAPKTPKAPKEKKPEKLSCLDAAAQLLAEAKAPMTCQDLIDIMGEKGLWSSPGGKTPANTLYAAILREINVKGTDSRFTKADPGLFAATGK